MANSLDLESQSEDGWMHMLYVYTKDEWKEEKNRNIHYAMFIWLINHG
jgi:hypothetical protein